MHVEGDVQAPPVLLLLDDVVEEPVEDDSLVVLAVPVWPPALQRLGCASQNLVLKTQAGADKRPRVAMSAQAGATHFLE
jgi:hypothetical protein